MAGRDETGEREIHERGIRPREGGGPKLQVSIDFWPLFTLGITPATEASFSSITARTRLKESVRHGIL